MEPHIERGKLSRLGFQIEYAAQAVRALLDDGKPDTLTGILVDAFRR